MSNGYLIPLGIDLGGSIKELDQLVSSLEAAKTAGAESKTAISNMNKEIADAGKKANETLQETSKNTLDAKKATEEKARVDKMVNDILAEREKLQQKVTKGVRENISGINSEAIALEKKIKSMQSEIALLNEKLKTESAGRESLEATIAVLEEEIEKTKEQSAAQELSNTSMKAGTVVASSLRTVLMSFITMGLGAVLAAIAIYWDDIKRAITGVTKEMELQNKVRQDAIGLYVEEKVHVENLWRESQNDNTTKSRKKAIIEELNKISPTYFNGIKTEKDLHEQGIDAIARYISSLELKARAQAAQEIYVEELKEQMRFEQRSLRESSSAWVQWAGMAADMMGKSSVAISMYVSSTDKNFTAQSEATSRAFKVMTDALDEVANLGEETTPKAEKVTNEYLKILESFIHQKEDAETQAIKDETDRAIKAEEQRFDREKKAIQKEVLEFKGSQQERVSLANAARLAIQALEEAHVAKLGAISLKALEDEAAKEKEANKLISAIRKENLNQQLKDVEEKYTELNNKIAEGGQLTLDIEIELEEAKNKELAAVRQKFALEVLKKDEDISIARIDSMVVNGKNEESILRLREAMKLQVMLDAAHERLDLLKKTGNAENELIILQTEKLIKDLSDKIEQVNSKNGGSLFEFLGVNEKAIKEFAAQLSTAGEIIGDVFYRISEGFQIQIDAKKEQIDAFTKQINNLEKELDRERRLQEKGFANNAELREKEIAAARAQQDQLIKEQEELQAKQQAAQRAQIVADSFSQASNLVTASTDIFKTFAKVPFIGVPLAIAAIGTMLGAFTISKANAFKAVAAGQKFEHGGEFVLDGPSHARGGLGVYDERTGRRVAEVEGGEGFFATNKKSTKKHRGLLEAINNDNFKDFHKFSASLDEILDHAGISLPQHDEIAKIVVVAQENSSRESEYKGAMISLSQNSDFLSSIARSNKEMLNIEKNKSEMLDMGDSILIKKGNVTRIIKKKDAV